ncbi:unnamed protein product [Chilo suppressalis]|uniref:N-acetyltransferase domain-containing protein n=1 Tax=Chilo suppressalis TaxID=168631 RepID=A0ABN8B121_CHISP|nr:unnamed protein product [Chilo suppressalis]
MNMDILVELSIDKWPELQKRVKEKWPLNVAGFYTLDLNMNYPNVRDAFNYKVYCPYGDIDKGFIAISDKDANVDFVLFATTEDTIGLEDALVNTKLINWNDKICVDLVTSSLEAIRKKFFAAYNSLNRLRNFLPTTTKITLAQTLLLTIIDYADACYTDLTEELLNKLERLQNLCIRFIFNLRKYNHISYFRSKLNWLPIRRRRDLHTLTLLYSVLFLPTSPHYLKERFSFLSSTSQRTLRSSSNLSLEIRSHSTDFFSYPFFVHSVRLWNSLPETIRRARTLNSFRDQVRSYFLSQQFPSNVYAAPVISNRVQIQRIDSTWPYKHSASDLYFTTLALSDLGYGLYLHGTENLIAWVFINEHSFLCHLYCEEEYRGRGYAEWLMKYVINDQLGKGKDLYTYVENYNAKSSRLFDKLGFDNIDQGAYMLLQK